LIFIYFSFSELFFALLLKRNDYQGDEYIDEKEGKNYKINNVEESHLHPMAGQWSVIAFSRVHRMLQNTM
jgi:hypothetical protein